MKREEITYSIIRNYCTISTNTKSGWTKELNLVSWEDRPAKYDIREWSPDHTKMGKGLTFTEDELRAIYPVLVGMFFEPDDAEGTWVPEPPKAEPKKEEPKKPEPKKEEPKKPESKKEEPKKSTKVLSGKELADAREKFFNDNIGYDTQIGMMDFPEYTQFMVMHGGDMLTFRVYGNSEDSFRVCEK